MRYLILLAALLIGCGPSIGVFMDSYPLDASKITSEYNLSIQGYATSEVTVVSTSGFSSAQENTTVIGNPLKLLAFHC